MVLDDVCFFVDVFWLDFMCGVGEFEFICCEDVRVGYVVRDGVFFGVRRGRFGCCGDVYDG